MVEHLFFQLKHQHFIHHQSNSGRARLYVINRHNCRQTIFWDDQMKGWWNDNCFFVRPIFGNCFQIHLTSDQGLAGRQCQISGNFSFKQVGFKSCIIAAMFHSKQSFLIYRFIASSPSFFYPADWFWRLQNFVIEHMALVDARFCHWGRKFLSSVQIAPTRTRLRGWPCFTTPVEFCLLCSLLIFLCFFKPFFQCDLHVIPIINQNIDRR